MFYFSSTFEYLKYYFYFLFILFLFSFYFFLLIIFIFFLSAPLRSALGSASLRHRLRFAPAKKLRFAPFFWLAFWRHFFFAFPPANLSVRLQGGLLSFWSM
jgi:hypothetical protein